MFGEEFYHASLPVPVNISALLMIFRFATVRTNKYMFQRQNSNGFMLGCVNVVAKQQLRTQEKYNGFEIRISFVIFEQLREIPHNFVDG